MAALMACAGGFAGLIGAGAARADEAASADESSRVIVVTGRGLAAGPAVPAYDTVVLPRAQIISSSSGRIEDVLSDVAGFSEFRRSDSRSANPSSQGVSLRSLGGNAASRTLVLLDGVPMADPMFGSVPFPALVPERLGAIRVTRGGGSGAFGAGSVAGTIEMESADANQLGLVNAEAMVDNRAETALSATLAPRLGAGFAEISGRWDRGQGFWTTPVDQRVPASAKAAYNSWSVSARGVAPIAPDVELQGRVMAYDDLRTLRFRGANSTSQGEDASLRLVGRGVWKFDALAYLQARDFSNMVISSSSYLPTLNQRRTPSTGLGGKLELRPPVGTAHVLRLGADWRRAQGNLWEDIYSAGSVSSHRQAGGRTDDMGLYAEDDWTLGHLVLTGGGRADYWAIAPGHVTLSNLAGAVTSSSVYGAREGWAPSGRAGAVWHVASALALRGSVYSSIRMPTINELYRTYTVYPVVTGANPALTNERLKGYEAGLDITPFTGAHISATAFYNRLEHAIANVTLSTNLRQRQNVDAIRARGLEVEAGVQRGPVSLDGSLSWTDAVVEASGAQAGINGLQPAQTPRFVSTATLGWHAPAGWQLATTLRYTSAQFEDDQQLYRMRPAATLGAFAQVPLRKGVSLVLRGENLTNVSVITRFQPTGAGSIDLGEPRTIWMGVRVGGH